MATGQWQPGYNKSITLFGISLKIRSSTWDEAIEKLIVTHSQSGGVQGWMAGILDGNGTVQACVDAGAVPPGYSIVAGAMGAMLYTLGSALPFIIPVGVVHVHYQTAVNTLVEYAFDVAINSEQGAYTRAS